MSDNVVLIKHRKGIQMSRVSEYNDQLSKRGKQREKNRQSSSF